MRFLLAMSRLSLVVALALAVVMSVSIVVPSVTAADSRPEVALALDIGFLPEGTPITVSLGLSAQARDSFRNGDDFELRGTPNATGLVTARDESGSLVAIGIAPKIPRLNLPRRPLNDESSAVGLIYSIPGLAGMTVLEDVLLLQAAYAVPELALAAGAIAEQRASGTNPLEDPSDETLLAVVALLEAANAELERRFAAFLEAIDPQLTQQSSATNPGGFSPVLLSATTNLPASDSSARPPLNVACETGLTDPSLCGNNLDVKPCLVQNPGLVFDSDGLDGDGICITARSFDPKSNTVTLAGANFLSRWALVYEASNRSLAPDAVIAPKQWTLPSVEKFVADLAAAGWEMILVGGANFVRENIPWADTFATKLIGLDELDETASRSITEPLQQMFLRYSSPNTSTFTLNAGPPDGSATGVRFSTYTFGWSRDGVGPRSSRWIMSLVMTSFTEWIVPSVLVFLDLNKSNGLGRHCKSFSEPEISNRPPSAPRGLSDDVCKELVKIAGVVVPIITDAISTQRDPELKDFVALAGQVAQVLATAVIDGIKGSGGGYYGGVEMGPEDIEFLEKQGLKSLKNATKGTVRFVDDAGREATPDEIILAAAAAVITFYLGSTDIRQISQAMLEQAVKTLLKSLTAVTKIIELINMATDAANILLGAAEILGKQDIDTTDTYVISVAGLESLPQPFWAFQDGDGEPGTTVLVIDVSPSMADPVRGPDGEGTLSKLEAAQEAASAYVSAASVGSQSNVNTSLGLVIFSDGSVEVVAPTGNVAEVSEALYQLQIGSGTNIESGLQQALTSLQGVSGPRRIILLSDGQDTVDPTGPHILSGSVASAVADGIPIDTIAFDLQDPTALALLDQISGFTGGRTNAVTTPGELSRVYVSSKHASSGQLIESFAEPMLGDYVTIDLFVPEVESGRKPAELFVTVALSGVPFDISLRDPNGELISPDSYKTVRSESSLSISLLNPPPGVITLQVTKLPVVPSAGGGGGGGGGGSWGYQEASIVAASWSHREPSLLLVQESVDSAPENPELVVVASVSGMSDTGDVQPLSSQQLITAMTMTLALMILALLFAFQATIRRRSLLP